MKKLAIVAWILALVSGSYLMVGVKTMYTSQLQCGCIVLLISLIASFAITIGCVCENKEEEEGEE